MPNLTFSSLLPSSWCSFLLSCSRLGGAAARWLHGTSARCGASFRGGLGIARGASAWPGGYGGSLRGFLGERDPAHAAAAPHSGTPDWRGGSDGSWRGGPDGSWRGGSGGSWRGGSDGSSRGGSDGSWRGGSDDSLRGFVGDRDPAHASAATSASGTSDWRGGTWRGGTCNWRCGFLGDTPTPHWRDWRGGSGGSLRAAATPADRDPGSRAWYPASTAMTSRLGATTFSDVPIPLPDHHLACASLPFTPVNFGL